MIHIEEVSRQKNGETDEPKSGMVPFTSAADAPKTNDFNPSQMHAQILYKPGEAIHTLTSDSVMTWLDSGSSYTRFMDPFGGWINTTRNWQTRSFLQSSDRRYLFMCDADVGVPWWVPYRLASHGLPVVSGVVPCFSLGKGGLFLNIACNDPSGTPRFPTLGGTKTIPKEGIVEIERSGAGCLVVRRDVLEKLWQMADDDPDFGQPFEQPLAEMRESGKTGRVGQGEDVHFTRRVKEAGFDMWADFACRCIHDKGMSLAWPDSALSDIDVEDWQVSVFDKQVRTV